MRLRNVKGATAQIEASSYIIEKPEEHKGKYASLFGNNNPIHIEIGMGKGRFIIENAKRYPDINFIGMEKFDNVMVRAVQQVELLALPNLKLIRADALEITSYFDQEIDMIYLNFSDPWPKNRHEKRRLSSDVFLEKYEQIMKNQLQITMKTDNRKLFEYSLVSFAQYGAKLQEISLDLYQDDTKDNIATEYEQRFHAKGFPIYRALVVKTTDK